MLKHFHVNVCTDGENWHSKSRKKTLSLSSSIDPQFLLVRAKTTQEHASPLVLMHKRSGDKVLLKESDSQRISYHIGELLVTGPCPKGFLCITSLNLH
jgi:hypothetical protein